MKTSAYLYLALGSVVAFTLAPTNNLRAEDAKPPAAAAPAAPATTNALDFGDSGSSTLVVKAWGALGNQDNKSAIGYTDKAIALYQAKAVEQQKSLKEPVPTDDKDKVFALGLLNDVGTAYYIRGQAHEAAGQNQEALADYKFLTENLAFAQTWDPQGWFWKPADAAAKRVKVLEFTLFPAAAGATNALDYGDAGSASLVGKAWAALGAKDYRAAIGYTGKAIELYQSLAVEQQKSLTEPVPVTDKDKVFAMGLLNDVGTAYYIRGQVYEATGMPKEALAAYKYLADNLAFAQTWDPKGWFWKPAEAAAKRVKVLEAGAGK